MTGSTHLLTLLLTLLGAWTLEDPRANSESELAGESMKPEETGARELPDEYVSTTLRRVEHFALTDSIDGVRVRDEHVLGLVEWREREVDGGQVLERDVMFAGASLLIRHVERLTEETTRLVWREAGPGVGRSQIVEPEGGRLRIVDWLRSGVERSSLEIEHPARFPLALLESFREGERMPTVAERYWPLTRSVERLSIATRYLAGAMAPGRRLIELTREDGSLAGRFLFDGDALEAFQWQEGGPWARRVSEARHARIKTRISGKRPVEAASQPR
jgi:hypothetical protein